MAKLFIGYNYEGLAMKNMILLTFFAFTGLVCSEPSRKSRPQSQEVVTIRVDNADHDNPNIQHITIDKTDYAKNSGSTENSPRSKNCQCSSRVQLALVSSTAAVLGAAITAAVTLSTNQC